MKYFLLVTFITITTFAFSQNDNAEAPFTYVEKMPSFPGGLKEMYKYVYSNMKYPVEARKNSISGTVIVQFDVMTDGTLSNLKVIQGIGYGCDEEAVRVVDSMNENHKWVPGEHAGKIVPVTYTLPLKFVLQRN